MSEKGRNINNNNNNSGDPLTSRRTDGGKKPNAWIHYPTSNEYFDHIYLNLKQGYKGGLNSQF